MNNLYFYSNLIILIADQLTRYVYFYLEDIPYLSSISLLEVISLNKFYIIPVLIILIIFSPLSLLIICKIHTIIKYKTYIYLTKNWINFYIIGITIILIWYDNIPDFPYFTFSLCIRTIQIVSCIMILS